MSPAFSRALDPLRYRPFLWMALAALAGVAAGGQWAMWCQPISRTDFRLLLPLLPAVICAPGIWRWWSHGFGRRLSIALLLFFGFSSAAARRITPPQGDISELAQVGKAPRGPVQAVSVQVRGVVADYPRIGDFNIQFPLECSSPRPGRIWITAPYGEKLEIGDEVELLTELHSLPVPTNVGERARGWQYVGANCWCLGRRVVVSARFGPVSGFGLARRIGGWRTGLLHYYETQFRGRGDGRTLQVRPFPAATAQLLTAMVFGEGGLSQPLPRVLREDFRAAGLSHLLVASGSQIGFVGIGLVMVAHAVGLKRKPLVFAILPVLILYALLAGGAASIWRATLGGFLILCSQWLGRDLDELSIWGAAILALLTLDPASAWSLSFQLTFAATWGLIVVAPALTKWLRSHFGESRLVELAALSVGAQSATLPFSLLHFGTFSLSGLAANFVAVPLAGVMVAMGMLGLIISPLDLGNYYLARGAQSLAHIFASLPGAQFEGLPVSLTSVWLYFGVLLLGMALLSFDAEFWRIELKAQGAALWKRVRQIGPQHLIPLFLLLGVWLWWLQYGPGSSKLRVTMIDVGQGESILIRTPSGHNVLIDGGSLDGQQRSDIGAQVLVPTLQSLGVDRLDLLVLTHSDADHCNGLATVAKEIPISNFLDGPSAVQAQPDPAQMDYWELRKTLSQLKVPSLRPSAGQSFKLGEASLRILGPSQPPLNSDNDNCIVARLDFGQSSFLFTGDIEKPAEERLLQRGEDLKCTVLKVAHHGSLGSTTPEFLKAASPRIALISCGRYNRFGHPGAGTLQKLESAGAAIFRTDVDGALEVDCDQKECAVTTGR